MSTVLYYSKYCEHSNSIIKNLSKSKIQDDIHFLSIDKRIKENDKTYIVLDSGKKILMPHTITKVPALLLLHHGNRVLFGNKIMEYFKPKLSQMNTQATKKNEEPLAFSFDISNTMSDLYSYLDQDANELLVKGKGGMRQPHNYVALGNKDSAIETPPEDYVKEKMNDKAYQKFEQSRNKDTAQYLSPHGQ
jgi:hypothetical protein